MKNYSGTFTEPPCDGRVVRLAGEDWIIPPLTFRLMKKHQEAIDSFGAVVREPSPDETPEEASARMRQAAQASVDRIEKMIDIVIDAMKRNYPDLERDNLEDLLDMENTQAAYRAALGLAEIKKPGEVQPAMTPATRLNGAAATA